MGRYLLRFQEKAEDAEREIRALPRTRILDSSPRTFLVDGPDDEVRTLAGARNWIIAEHTMTPAPVDPHPRVARTTDAGSGRKPR